MILQFGTEKKRGRDGITQVDSAVGAGQDSRTVLRLHSVLTVSVPQSDGQHKSAVLESFDIMDNFAV